MRNSYFMKLKLGCAILFIFICSFCAFGQRSKVRKKRAVNKPAVSKSADMSPCENIQSETDRMTSVTKQFTNIPTVLTAGGGRILRVTWLREPDHIGDKIYGDPNIIFEVTALDNLRPVYMPKWANIVILLESGEKISGGIAQSNSKGLAYHLIGARETEMMKLSKIIAIRVYTIDGYIEADLTPRQSDAILRELECLSSMN